MNAVIVETSTREPSGPAMWRPSSDIAWEGMLIPTNVRRVPATEVDAAGADRLVFALQGLAPSDARMLSCLEPMIGGAHRRGQEVYLVRCSEELHRLWSRGGLSQASRHAGSVAAATRGLIGEIGGYGEFSMSASTDQIPRMVQAVDVIFRRAGLADDRREAARRATTAALENATTHGSPLGPRQHVRIAFNMEPDALLLDIEDRGPGFEVPSSRPSRDGEEPGLTVMRSGSDRMETFRLAGGTLVRLIWQRSGARPQRCLSH